jgi:hypothetical protein
VSLEKYLYRALRKEEIELGYVLFPKNQEPFKANPRLDIDTRFPFVLGPTTEHAIRQHQWKQNGFPTRGISTTPHLERAQYYAQKNKAIVKLDRDLFEKHKIMEFVVKDWLEKFPSDIAIPEDDEVILVMEHDGPFPKEIIHEVILLK